MSTLDDWATETPLDELAQRRKDVAACRIPLEDKPKPRTHDIGFWAAAYTVLVMLGIFFAGTYWLATTGWHHPAGTTQLLFVIALPPVAMLAVHIDNRRRG